MERKNLREARESRHWTQDYVAEALSTRRKTVSDGPRRETVSEWERGKTCPSRENREALYDLFGCETYEEREALLVLTEEPKPVEERVIIIAVPRCVERNLCSQLLCIAHTSYKTPHELTLVLQQAIKDFDTMSDLGNITIKVSRREALCTLAALPMTTLGKNPNVPTRYYSEMLVHCTAALEACWQLYRSSDPIGSQYAFDCCCSYVPLLESIAHNAPQLRGQALDLAAHYAILQTMLGWSCAKSVETLGYAQKAMNLSKETGNISLQLSAYTKLGYSYLTIRQYASAWKTRLEGEHVLNKYQGKRSSPPLSSGIVGSFNSSYAMVQADNGLDPDHALGIATDSETLNEHVAFIEFTQSAQWLEAARTCTAYGDFKKAIICAGKRIDTETLAPRDDVLQSRRGRFMTINTLTRALLQSPERNLEKIIAAWTTGMKGAQSLRSERLYTKAVTNFEIMQTLYPREQSVLRLAPLTEHW